MALIDLHDIHLSYPVYGADARNFKSAVLSFATGGFIHKERGAVHVEALRGVSLHLKPGDRLALLGHNGAGKSTLLRLLARIYTPSSGHFMIAGKSSCLFDIMMGMDPDLNGYENIILRGRIAGLSKKEAQSLIPKVEEFSELGSFMDMPFKTYSSGMQLRLAFGIITNILAEIVLIDEILNVGDANFAKKACDQLTSLVNQSEILVVSTHDLSMVRRLCNKALWLEHGKIKMLGDLDLVLNCYDSSSN